MSDRIYAAVDLKSFYASVECVDRGLDPMCTHLVVADASRTEKTICLAVSPSLKACGISGRARLFEVVERVKEVNAERLRKAPGGSFSGSSPDMRELAENASLKLDYITAVPRMKRYIEVSTQIYGIYKRFVSPDDMHIYSVDEVFLDITAYLKSFHKTPVEYVKEIVQAIFEETHIVATAGIGTNLYLAKIAMDIGAKHTAPDKDGVRTAMLDVRKYREQLWDHRPISDFWRVGSGYARKLEANGIRTMGDVARCSVSDHPYWNMELLYRLFGVNAELLIDHAWGIEPVTIADIRSYRPDSSGISRGQVLSRPYTKEEARVVLSEMIASVALELAGKRFRTDQIVLTVGYDRENTDRNVPGIEKETDRYGRTLPKHAHGTANLGRFTSLEEEMLPGVLALYDRIVSPALTVRRMYVNCNHLTEAEAKADQGTQLDLFAEAHGYDKEAEENRRKAESRQKAVLEIQRKFGKNAIMKGNSLLPEATLKERNAQMGGHKA